MSLRHPVHFCWHCICCERVRCSVDEYITHTNEACHTFECDMYTWLMATHTHTYTQTNTRTHTHTHTHTHVNVLYRTYEWDMPHMYHPITRKWATPHTWVSHATHPNESWHTCEYTNETCHTYITSTHKWAMPHTWVRHATHPNESRHKDMNNSAWYSAWYPKMGHEKLSHAKNEMIYAKKKRVTPCGDVIACVWPRKNWVMPKKNELSHKDINDSPRYSAWYLTHPVVNANCCIFSKLSSIAIVYSKLSNELTFEKYIVEFRQNQLTSSCVIPRVHALGSMTTLCVYTWRT